MCNKDGIKNFVNKIQNLETVKVGAPIDVKDIILYQKELMKKNIAQVPKSFIKLLHHCNAISSENACVFGISPQKKNFFDIMKENSQNSIFPSNTVIVLGYDDFDYMAYNYEKSKYQIIDKKDLEVLEEYKDLELALLYILKI